MVSFLCTAIPILNVSMDVEVSLPPAVILYGLYENGRGDVFRPLNLIVVSKI
jgi:hypothetical protein